MKTRTDLADVYWKDAYESTKIPFTILVNTTILTPAILNMLLNELNTTT
jgi:hypothetical protein